MKESTHKRERERINGEFVNIWDQMRLEFGLALTEFPKAFKTFRFRLHSIIYQRHSDSFVMELVCLLNFSRTENSKRKEVGSSSRLSVIGCGLKNLDVLSIPSSHRIRFERPTVKLISKLCRLEFYRYSLRMIANTRYPHLWNQDKINQFIFQAAIEILILFYCHWEFQSICNRTIKRYSTMVLGFYWFSSPIIPCSSHWNCFTIRCWSTLACECRLWSMECPSPYHLDHHFTNIRPIEKFIRCNLPKNDLTAYSMLVALQYYSNPFIFLLFFSSFQFRNV